MWSGRTAALIAGLFLAAAVGYWFGSGNLDPAGTVMLVFAAGAIAFGFTILFRSSEEM